MFFENENFVSIFENLHQIENHSTLAWKMVLMMEYEQNVWNMIIKLYFDQMSTTYFQDHVKNKGNNV